MKKSYYLVPLAALVAFIALHAWSQDGARQREAARAAAALVARDARIAAEKAARDAAIAEALVLQEQRQKERAERDAREAAEREIRAAALDTRDTAFREQERLKREAERLRREIAAETEIVTRLQRDHDDLLAEKKHLEALAPRTAATAADLERVLRQIATAEAARIKAAAEAAKSKS
jgi:hypothetical protein